MNEEIQENTKYRRNPAINEKLEKYMENNPDLVKYYGEMDKDELVRKACLSRMQKEERSEKFRAFKEQENEKAKEYLDKNPGIKEKMQKQAENVMLQRARQHMKQSGVKVGI